MNQSIILHYSSSRYGNFGTAKTPSEFLELQRKQADYYRRQAEIEAELMQAESEENHQKALNSPIIPNLGLPASSPK